MAAKSRCSRFLGCLGSFGIGCWLGRLATGVQASSVQAIKIDQDDRSTHLHDVIDASPRRAQSITLYALLVVFQDTGPIVVSLRSSLHLIFDSVDAIFGVIRSQFLIALSLVYVWRSCYLM